MSTIVRVGGGAEITDVRAFIDAVKGKTFRLSSKYADPALWLTLFPLDFSKIKSLTVHVTQQQNDTRYGRFRVWGNASVATNGEVTGTLIKELTHSTNDQTIDLTSFTEEQLTNGAFEFSANDGNRTLSVTFVGYEDA